MSGAGPPGGTPNSAGHDPSAWCGVELSPGGSVWFDLTLTESYSGSDVTAPVHVIRGEADGPALLVTAAVHGDEINGTGAIRRIIRERPFELRRGTLVLVPVVNMVGFERHARYLPDRRDLNRSFPGWSEGSLAGRMAWSFFHKIVERCDYCIDLHTAAVRRTNFPNVRADMSDPRVAGLARAFGAELIVNGRGPKGSLRRTACRAGCATLILEAGEVWRVQPGALEYALRGIENCLIHLGMIGGQIERPAYQFETDTTKWVRAAQGGFLEFHVSPGQIVEAGEALATNTDLAGEQQSTITSPRGAIVLGMTTMPAVAPGDPVCHLAFSKRGVLSRVGRVVDKLGEDSLHEQTRDDLARGMTITEPMDAEPTTAQTDGPDGRSPGDERGGGALRNRT